MHLEHRVDARWFESIAGCKVKGIQPNKTGSAFVRRDGAFRREQGKAVDNYRRTSQASITQLIQRAAFKTHFDKEVTMGVRSSQRTAAEYRRVLTNIFEFMLACGLARKEILAVARMALSRAKAVSRDPEKDMPGGLATAALVLDAWHRERLYLTSSGRPRPVRLLGPPPSVEALIRAQPGCPRPAALARRLSTQRLLVAVGRGRFKPASNVALLSAFDPLTIQHVARSLAMLLETIRQNLTGTHASQRLIERIAEVPDLPLQHVPAFRKFTQAQGWILLRTVNDWLEARRARGSSKSEQTVRAGIHVHTYVGGGAERFFGRGKLPALRP